MHTSQKHDWHSSHHTEVAEKLGTDPRQGLSEEQAQQRLAAHGPNAPSVKAGRGPLLRFLAQFSQPLVLVLIGAGTITAFLGEWLDSGVIFAVVVINAAIGFVQEGKAEAALAALARAIAAETTVLRGGEKRRIDASQLVPGDVVHLASGDKVPADLRLFASKEMHAAEAALTGESVPVAKDPANLHSETPLAERRNMAYTGTLVVSGQGAGLVVATGDATEAGNIYRLMAQSDELATPLTRKINAFASRLLIAILVLAALTFAVGMLRGETPFNMFMAAVALAVGAIPEGLPAVVTVTLAMGVARMARRRAIIRRLPAVETLGSTTVICSDKTGTLTENAMTVRQIHSGGERFDLSGDGYDPSGTIAQANGPVDPAGALRETLLAGVLCNDAGVRQEDGQWLVSGDPTEAALLVAARKGDLNETTLARVFPRLDELPFDSSRQYMATLHEIEGSRIVYVKGALEKLLPACIAMLDSDGHETSLEPQAISAAAHTMASSGLRVLALAHSRLETGLQLEHEHISSGLVFLGLMGMIDPPRAQAIVAVRACHAAGIRVKMITGDHPGTASAIAFQLGIAGENARVLTGRELAALDDEALGKAALQQDIFARVEPEQKLRLVKALQAAGEVVAMTGDGVNDAPALKQADIGVAMGLGGTEVAKEAADMVLTDDNFAAIEAAVEEGRGIYDNLVKFITWTIPTNAAEGLVILMAVLLGTILPIAPLQILWINMTTAVLLGLMLAFEPAEGDIMERPPRPPAAPILDRQVMRQVLLVTLLMLVGAFGMFEFSLYQGMPLEAARTVAANIFVMVEMVYLFNCRSLRHPLWQLAPFSNPWVWYGSAAMLLLQMAFTYWPPLNSVFGTAPIAWQTWAIICAYALFSGVVVEADKVRHQRTLNRS